MVAGIAQTGLYLDFFYVYFTKCVHPELSSTVQLTASQGDARRKVRTSRMISVYSVQYIFGWLFLREHSSSPSATARQYHLLKLISHCYKYEDNDALTRMLYAVMCVYVYMLSRALSAKLLSRLSSWYPEAIDSSLAFRRRRRCSSL